LYDSWLFPLAGKSLATLPRFEPVRRAAGLSTPHPSGTQVPQRLLTRLRRRTCAPPPFPHRFARVLTHCDPSAPLLPALPAFGRGVADESLTRLRTASHTHEPCLEGGENVRAFLPTPETPHRPANAGKGRCQCIRPAGMAAESERSAFEFSPVSKRGESRHLQALTASGITGGVFLFSLGVFCGCWFPVSGKCINSLETGHRVWTEAGLCDHGHKKVNVPAKTGGTIEPFPSYSGGVMYHRQSRWLVNVSRPRRLVVVQRWSCLSTVLVGGGCGNSN